MNRTLAVLTLAGLMSSVSPMVCATERPVEETTLPPHAVPGINQPNVVESHKEKADKKGEEAAGSNAGAEAGEMHKEADSAGKPPNDASGKPEGKTGS
jgi:hypothetical protein